MKIYAGEDVYIHVFLTSALVGGEWSASRLGGFNPGKREKEDRRLGVPQNRPGSYGEVNILYSTETRTLTPWSSSP
jgi:hypothetical protein